MGLVECTTHLSTQLLVSYLMKGLLQYTKGESGWGFNVYWLSTCDDG